MGGAVENLDAGEYIGNFRAVGAHVLDWGGAGGAGDSGEAFNSTEAGIHRKVDNIVPNSACIGGEETVGEVDGDVVGFDDDGNNIQIAVGHDEIGPAADDEEGEGGVVKQFYGADQRLRGLATYGAAGFSADAEGRQIGESDFRIEFDAVDRGDFLG